MLPLPAAIITVLSPFAALFSRPVWGHVQVLLIGAVLCRGPRTVTAILRVLGLGGEKRFEKYHRVLNRARWSGLQGGKILLGILVQLLPASWPIVIGTDDTIERRRGSKITAKGCYRDAVRSTEKYVVTCFGLKWMAMMLLVPLPWSRRPWALPFLTVLAPSQRAHEAAGQRHKTTIDWTMQMVKVVSRWLRGHPWILLGDGSYACVRLAWACRAHHVALITRLRLDAQLHAWPEPVPPGKRGRKPTKGKRLPALQTRVDDQTQPWQETTVRWYGGEYKQVRLLSEVCLWYTPGERPVPIRWVLVGDPAGKLRPAAFFSTDLDLAPAQVVEWFVLRWNVEVTFEEGRRHLGVETQRQWSALAIARSTPALFGLFSLVCVMAARLSTVQVLQGQATTWYLKEGVTFSDVLAYVRRALWATKYFDKSTSQDEQILLSAHDWDVLLDQLASAA
jgi:DDE superfamily endonuclease